jgi:CheY-like chemotaxis protein
MAHETPVRMLRFLLIEDDDDHATIVFRSLKAERVGNRVDRVVDGVEALAYLRQEREYAAVEKPDIVLLDLKLPKLSGHEVLAAMKDDPKLRDIPVVVLSTSDAEKDMVRAYQHHANSYLVKPLDAACFRKMVENLRLYWGVWNRAPEHLHQSHTSEQR